MDIKKRITAAQKRVQKKIDESFAKLSEDTAAAFKDARTYADAVAQAAKHK